VRKVEAESSGMAGLSLPPEAAFHVKAAVGWIELGSAAEARHELESLDPAFREHPDVLEAWWPVLVEERNWPDALISAEKLVAAAPEREAGWVQQSFALHELKRTAEAYERLIQVAERFPEAYVIPYNLACYQCQMKNGAAALKWLKRAAEVADWKTIRAMALQDPDLEPLREEVTRLGRS
jgi:predicted Zn-dependent protease